jgi:hypothetical protein
MRPHLYAKAFVLAAGTLAPRHARSQQSHTTLDSTIVGLERQTWEAYKRNDPAAFFKITGPSFLWVQPKGISRATQAGRKTFGCQTRSYAMDSITVTPVGNNVAVLAYRVTLDQTCGGGQPEPSPQYNITVWARRNGQWQVVSVSETPAHQAGSK